jgi:zinc protease
MCREYYRARYLPNNLTFVIVGDVDAGEVYAQLEKYFTGYPARSLPPGYIAQEPPQQGRREVNEEFSTELTRLALAWHIPEITHPDVPSIDLLSTVLGDGRSSRLYRRVREEAGLAFGISAFSYTPGDPGLLGIDATLEPEHRVEAERLILEIIAELQQSGVTAEELAKAKKDFARPFVRLAHHHAGPGVRSRLELVRHAQPQLHARLSRGDAKGVARGHPARRPALSGRG